MTFPHQNVVQLLIMISLDSLFSFCCTMRPDVLASYVFLPDCFSPCFLLLVMTRASLFVTESL